MENYRALVGISEFPGFSKVKVWPTFYAYSLCFHPPDLCILNLYAKKVACKYKKKEKNVGKVEKSQKGFFLVFSFFGRVRWKMLVYQ